MHCSPDQFWLLASYLKIYCGPIWRNLHFPVPVNYRNSIASKIDATHVIKAHSITQCVMHGNAGKMNQWVSRFSNFLGEAPRPPPARDFGAHVGASPPLVPLSDGLDTRPCQILDPPLTLQMGYRPIRKRYYSYLTRTSLQSRHERLTKLKDE